MVDLHCHILPDMDDGARDFETSLSMCRIAQKNGIKHIVATPHISCLDDVDAFVEKRDAQIEKLTKKIEENGLNIKIYPGAEVYVDDDIFFSRKLNRLTINNSRYLLVEFAFEGITFPQIITYLDAVVDMGLVPVIAHPERYGYFQYNYEYINDLMRRGAIFQINAASLASMDGPNEFELAYAMAFNGIASFIGTDAHSNRYRSNNISEMIELFPPDISQKNMESMLSDNGKYILDNEELPYLHRREIFKRLF